VPPTMPLPIRPVVEVQGAGDGSQYGFGDVRVAALFQAGVVVRADPGQKRDLLAAQPGHPAGPAAGGQSGAVRGEAGPMGAQEVAVVCLRLPIPEHCRRCPTGAVSPHRSDNDGSGFCGEDSVTDWQALTCAADFR
jgi:hypothetical protein